MASMHVATRGYFETMRIPLRSGRDFTAGDEVVNGPARVIVDRRLADQLWPGRSAVGQRIRLVQERPPIESAEVIGVVDHVQFADLRHAGLPQIYESLGMRPYSVAFVVRTLGDPPAVAGAIKHAVERLGPGRPVFAVRTLQSLVDDAGADTRFTLLSLAVFASLAVSLTAVGVYGVVAYSTARRRREIAVRRALGADARRIVMLVVGEGLGWTVTGLAAGTLGARVLTRYLDALLFNVSATDAATFAGVGVLLAVVALAATALPALRAVRIDPMLALKSE
jgi:predicted lysophospholipase L1 biosynthesis ABC-type transport system permease subunit